jgi:hypothetical protein
VGLGKKGPFKLPRVGLLGIEFTKEATKKRKNVRDIEKPVVEGPTLTEIRAAVHYQIISN